MNYSNYKNLILQQCWKLKKRNSHLELEDLIGEANLIFTKVMKTFDEIKEIKFSTYLTVCLNFGLNNYIKKENNWHFKTETDMINLHKTENFSFFELSDNSKRILSELEYVPASKKNKIVKQNIVKHFKNKLTNKEIYNSFAEIKECLN